MRPAVRVKLLPARPEGVRLAAANPGVKCLKK